LAFPDDGRGAGERAARRWGPSEDLGLSEYAINLVGHAHIDLAYRWRWNETVHRIARDTFRGVLDLMNEEPGLTFAQSQMALYDAMKREYPTSTPRSSAAWPKAVGFRSAARGPNRT